MFQDLPVIVDEYELYEKISAGAYGVVYKARSLKYDNISFAIKVVPLSKKNGERSYSAEINALMNLDHPGIVKIYKNFVYQKSFFIVYELCVHTLEDEITQLKPPLVRRLMLLQQVSSALAYCHRYKICHRDIKATNVLIDNNGNAKLSDFGLAMILNNDESEIAVCEGSPAYCPPEILTGHVHNPFMADVWSFGVLIYFLFTGEIPWPKDTFEEMKNAICTKNMMIPMSIPRKMSAVINSCMKQKPAERIPMEDIETKLKEFKVGAKQGTPNCPLANLKKTFSQNSMPALNSPLGPGCVSSPRFILEGNKKFTCNRLILRPIVKFV